MSIISNYLHDYIIRSSKIQVIEIFHRQICNLKIAERSNKSDYQLPKLIQLLIY